MVRLRNPEWKLFGPQYSVPGAAVDKVDCSACKRQVSASANRLKAHLRICPARPLEQQALDESSSSSAVAPATVATASEPTVATAASEATTTLSTATPTTQPPLDPPEPQQHAPPALASRSDDAVASAPAATCRSTLSESTELPDTARELLSVAIPSARASAPAALATEARSGPQWVALEEKRLLLEMKRDEREERRERLQLAILEAQARREQIAAERESCEAKVQLVLARKRLRDEGIDDDEIARILPVPRV